MPLTPGGAAGAASERALGGPFVGPEDAPEAIGAAGSARVYVDAAAGRLLMPIGARGAGRCSVRTCGMVLITGADDASSPGTLTRFDLTGRRLTRDVAGTADRAPGTARLTWRVGSTLGRSFTSIPWGRLKRAQQLDEHRRQPG